MLRAARLERPGEVAEHPQGLGLKLALAGTSGLGMAAPGGLLKSLFEQTLRNPTAPLGRSISDNVESIMPLLMAPQQNVPRETFGDRNTPHSTTTAERQAFQQQGGFLPRLDRRLQRNPLMALPTAFIFPGLTGILSRIARGNVIRAKQAEAAAFSSQPKPAARETFVQQKTAAAEKAGKTISRETFGDREDRPATTRTETTSKPGGIGGV